MQLLRLLLSPFTPLYYFIVWLRAIAYKNGILKSTAFTTPIIVVGNLSVGGTGKSPMVEYIANLLHPNNSIAILSRGYGRKTKGFNYVETTSDTTNVGDEPLQFKNKFKDVTVAVCEDRITGIKTLLKDNRNTSAIILDDAYQHLKVKAGLNILLTDYNHPFYNDYVLPAGLLREPRAAYKRADIIIVTKCKPTLSEEEKNRITQKINPLPNQKIFFSYIGYKTIVSIYNSTEATLKDKHVLLLTGIANPTPLHHFVKMQGATHIDLKTFPDHHIYTPTDITDIKNAFNNIIAKNKIILTTEKDKMRLQNPELKNAINDLPIYYIPIAHQFLFNEAIHFNKQILDYVSRNKTNS